MQNPLIIFISIAIKTTHFPNAFTISVGCYRSFIANYNLITSDKILYIQSKLSPHPVLNRIILSKHIVLVPTQGCLTMISEPKRGKKRL